MIRFDPWSKMQQPKMMIRAITRMQNKALGMMTKIQLHPAPTLSTRKLIKERSAEAKNSCFAIIRHSGWVIPPATFHPSWTCRWYIHSQLRHHTFGLFHEGFVFVRVVPMSLAVIPSYSGAGSRIGLLRAADARLPEGGTAWRL